MATVSYRTSASVATAVAVLLSLPPVGQSESLRISESPEYQPLDEASSRLLARAIENSPYIVGDSMMLLSMMTEVALRLVKESKPLDQTFSKIVDREFWNLLA